MYKSLFYSKFLIPRVKIIMYQSVIRPIKPYACPIWFNISPSYMEKLRIFERICEHAATYIDLTVAIIKSIYQTKNFTKNPSS